MTLHLPDEIEGLRVALADRGTGEHMLTDLLTSLLLLAMAGLAWAGAWASWPTAQGASWLLGILGGVAAVLAAFALIWPG